MPGAGGAAGLAPEVRDPGRQRLATSVNHHTCLAARMGVREIQVDVLTSDVMAGAGGAAGPAPDVRYQPEGTVRRKQHFQWLYTLH